MTIAGANTIAGSIALLNTTSITRTEQAASVSKTADGRSVLKVSTAVQSLNITQSRTLIPYKSNYNLIDRLKGEGKGDLLVRGHYDLVDRLKEEGRLIDRSTLEGITRLIDEQRASFIGASRRGQFA